MRDVVNNQDRERELESQKTLPNICKVSRKCNTEEYVVDLSAALTLPEKTDKQQSFSVG